jgi:hypothetical protein
MSLPVAIQRYLEKRAIRRPWRIEGARHRDYRGAVIIPALAESECLFATLAGLQANPPALLDRFLVVVVVNHRQDAVPADKQDNLLTLRKLAETSNLLPHLGWVDAASDGLELPLKNGGVGLARRIGFDLTLECLDWTGSPILATLDADTLVRADYLPALAEHFTTAAGGAVVPFCHQAAGSRAEHRAIVAYELYLRSHVFGLELAGSPYAFHTVGSTMACRAYDYVRSGGMNRRRAGEDFYFLQQLAKTSGVQSVAGTVVYPSARISNRTPFGTGRSVDQLAAEAEPARLYYDPRCYEILGAWLKLATAFWQAGSKELLDRATAVNPALARFLVREGLEEIWTGLCRNHAGRQRRLSALHGWFDGLKTARLVHYLTDSGWPWQTAAEALPPLFSRAGLPVEGDAERQLTILRKRQIGTACDFAGCLNCRNIVG